MSPRYVSDSPHGPEIYQLIISEIMADPVPQIHLPEFEYIEIFNRSSSSVDLSGMRLCIGNREAQLPDVVMDGNRHLILCNMDNDSIFRKYGKTLPLSGMPPILNTGKTITLKTADGKIIHSVSFTDKWYGNAGASEGGRSLEIIDTENPCGQDENWGVSINSAGGTPGAINSVSGSNPDVSNPFLIRTTLPSDSAVLLYFSEPMHPETLLSPENYSVNNGLFHPDEIFAIEPDLNKVLLKFHEGIKEDCLYTVSVLNTLEDCAGNILTGKSFADFALSRTPVDFDIVINEILFSADEDSPEFIELYNRSEKVIEISELSLSLLDHATFEIKKKIILRSYPFILFPHKYVVFTSDMHKLVEFPNNSSLGSLLELPLFTLPDEEGLIVLNDTNALTIDELHYSGNMHEPMLKETNGISLERVNPELPSDDPENWHSASTASGYSTPGFQNSQHYSDDGWKLTLTSEYISPDDDGFEDYVTLHLHLSEPGWIGSFTVYNVKGKEISALIRNALLGTEEDITWDGTCSDGRIAEIGLYVLYGELFSPSGKSKNFKKVIPLIIK